ncbi:MAG: PD40 domain-containing protein [Bacteroidetes bacterium]|nr:PD40 domain-containing protein [Bacteroidota bacterium]
MNSIFRFIFFISIACSCVPVRVFAQDEAASPCPPPDDEDAKKNFEKAKDKKKYNWDERMAFLKTTLEEEPTWADANYQMAKNIITKAVADGNEGIYPGAIPYLKAAVDACPDIGAEPFYQLGTQYYLQEDYPNTIIYLTKYINYETDDPKKLGKDYDFFSGQAQEMLQWSKFYVDVKTHPHPFDPVPVKGICTDKDEYLAIVSPDNTLALYIRKVPISSMDRVWGSASYREVFTESKKQSNGEFDAGEFLDDPFNKNPNEGGPTLTIDNKHLFYTITKDTPDGPNTDIYTSDFVDGAWTEIRSIGEKVNDPIWWDSQPTVSADGNTLYFASNRPGGQGGIDIWVTKKNTEGEWGVPVNAGPVINTQFDEKSPFIHSDSQTLYFSSNGHPGVGGYDIFYSRSDAKGNWQTPVNLGLPINTTGDDLGFFVSTDGKTGFFCSNAQINGQVGGWDVYQFELYPEARPEAVVILKGELKDDFGNPLSGKVDVEVKDVQTKEVHQAVVDTTSGSFAAAIRISKKEDFVISVKKDSAAFNSTLVSTKDGFKSSAVDLKPMNIDKLKVGNAYTINDINFATSSAVIEPESMVVLEEFAAYLKEHPHIKIEIDGHTDDVGDDKQNMDLSNERAYAVFEALTTKFGVPRSQITGSHGYGETRPKVPNDSDEHRAMNRRTEFVLIAQ